MARVGYRLCSASLWPLYHRGFADNGWFDLNIYTNNPNPNPYFVYESLICRRQFWRMEISVDRSGEALPRVPAPYPLKTLFDRKGAPFVYRSLTNGTPFTYLVLFFTSFNCYKCAVFKMWINHKTKKFSRLFYSHKIHLVILLIWAFSQTDLTDFPSLSYTPGLVKSPAL